MPVNGRSGFVGLFTATSEVIADQGALTVADNVTLRKRGSLTSRYGFALHKALTRRYEAAIPYQKKWVFLEDDTSFYGDDQTLIDNPVASGARVRPDIISWQEARKNLYIATAAGVLKMSSPDDAALSRTGLFVSDVLLSTEDSYDYEQVGGTWLEDGYQVGYRAVAVKTDANGVQLRARPTSMLTVVNTSGAEVAPTVFVDIAPADTGKLDKIELYRTRQFPAGQTKDDELQLVATITRDQILSAATRPYRHVDRVADEERGVTLYTSPSRGGIEAANDRPPGCACLELFRGSLFFGNLVGHQRLILSYNTPGESQGPEAIGTRTIQCFSAGPGATTITVATGWALDGVRVGQQVQGPAQDEVDGDLWPYRVTAVTDTEVTVSPALRPGTPPGTPQNGVYFQFRDVIELNGVLVPLDARTLAHDLAQAGGGYTAYTLIENDPYAGIMGYDVSVVIESLDPSAAPVAVRVSGGQYTSPPQAEFTDPAPTMTEADVMQNGLAWSEPDEPEHVPIRNRARIADAGKAILGLVAARDSLFILKEDGVYRLTGYHPDFRIDPFDTSAACILPGSIQRLNNTIYCLCVSGIVSIGEDTGVVTISRPIQDQIAPIVLAIRRAKDTSGQYVMPGMSPSASAIDEAHGEYLLGLGTTSPSFGGQMLVYSSVAEGFTTYTLRDDPVPVPPPDPPVPPRVPHALATSASGAPVPLTLAEQLVVAEGPIYALVRVSPHGFSETALVQKVWSHVVAGVRQLYGATVVSVRFFGAMPQPYPATAVSSIIEALDLPLPPVPPPTPPPPAPPPLIDLYGGSLLRHPVPRVLARSWVLRIELLVELYWGEVELVLLGAESRDGIANKAVQHAREAM